MDLHWWFRQMGISIDFRVVRKPLSCTWNWPGVKKPITGPVSGNLQCASSSLGSISSCDLCAIGGWMLKGWLCGGLIWKRHSWIPQWEDDFTIDSIGSLYPSADLLTRPEATMAVSSHLSTGKKRNPATTPFQAVEMEMAQMAIEWRFCFDTFLSMGWLKGKSPGSHWTFHWNRGPSCNFSLKPIHWL